MKRKNGYIALLMVVLMTIFIGNPTSDVQADDSQTIVAVETEGNHIFNCMNAILEEDMNSREPLFHDFLDNYGGGYIDGTHLNIYVKGRMFNLELFEMKMAEKGIDSSQYDIISVDHSYSDLESQMESFWEFRNKKLLEGSDWARLVYSVAISQERNCVLISISKNFDIYDSPELVGALSEINYEIETLNEEPKKIEETTLKPGMGISTGGSIGFRCKLNGNAGVVTAIHTSSYSSLNPISYAGTSFGSITSVQYGNSADFCFIKITNSSFSASRVTNTSPSYTLHESHYVTALPDNYTIYMAGTNSSSVRQGSVVHYSGSVSGDSGTDWLISSYTSSGGDSGGCLFAVVDGDNCVVGIHDGTYGSNKYGTKYTRMKSFYSTLTLY